MQSSFEKNPEMLESIYWWLVVSSWLIVLPGEPEAVVQ
jgi:hypothetical protein